MTNTEARALLDIIIFSLKEVRDRRKEEKRTNRGIWDDRGRGRRESGEHP